MKKNSMLLRTLGAVGEQRSTTNYRAGIYIPTKIVLNTCNGVLSCFHRFRSCCQTKLRHLGLLYDGVKAALGAS